MIPFLSDEGERRHREYIEGLKKRLDYLYKSCEELRGYDNKRLLRVGRLNRDLAYELRALRAEILLHEIYFSSFSDREYPLSKTANLCFGTGHSLLYEIKKAALLGGVKFAGVCRCGEGLRVFGVVLPDEIFSIGEPLLAVDMAEHAYFLEFGFNKEEYLRRALVYLNLAILDKNIQPS